MPGKDRSGFTLMELLVVTALVSILSAVLYPAFALARDAARRSTCLSNLRQLAVAHQAYSQDYDDTLPFWYVSGAERYTIWPEFLNPYYHERHLLDEGSTAPAERKSSGWLADYALCTWGPGGRGTLEQPHWRWPGSPLRDARTKATWPMRQAEVQRPAETLQFTDGFTSSTETVIRSRHRNEVLNGAFLDGHAGPISQEMWHRIDQDEHGYFYTMITADR
jgi:prepilin-type N-terminal cleavage/methylation domain-containing protein/prepilin-type processing-associated H-X9-DG protein